MDAELGKYNTLKVIKILDFGAYLEANGKEILLPLKYMPEGLEVGDELEVFIYRDSEDRVICTTLKPFAEVGDCTYLKVLEIGKAGAFLDWGIAKDLLVPFNEQKVKMEEGKYYLVYVYIDEETDRITGTAKVGRYIKNDEIEVKEGEEVDLLICETTDLGIRVVVNNKHWGLIYNNEVFSKVKRGDRVKGFVKKIREENKLDISLQKQGYGETLIASEKILEKLKEDDGYLALTDKTAPEEIYKKFGMSKKTFKKAIGALYKQRQIEIDDNGIRLIEIKHN